LKRAAASAANDAYQGAFEAVGSVLIACAFGYWVDRYWDTSPIGLLVGAVIGFAAMVLRLMRMGKEIYPDGDGMQTPATGEVHIEVDADLGTGEAPGLSGALRDDAATTKITKSTEPTESARAMAKEEVDTGNGDDEEWNGKRE
jgi:hypothetical protein